MERGAGTGYFMAMEIIASESDVVRALAASEAAPIFIYKHSPICGLSSAAIREFLKFTEMDASGFRFFQVDVIGARPASLQIEDLTRIRHESPQALLIWRSECVWHASHRRIQADALLLQSETMRKNMPA